MVFFIFRSFKTYVIENTIYVMKINFNSTIYNTKTNPFLVSSKKYFSSRNNQNLLETSNSYYNKCSIYYLRKNINFGMKEDIFATSRNGHRLIDTYDENTNSIDIRSNGLYPSNVISNLAHNEFVFDGVKCASIEGFLQSLKTENIDKQIEICASYGGSAKKISRELEDWKKTETVHWKGKSYNRNSEAFKKLLLSAYKACYDQNEIYRNALNSTIGKNLTHISGKKNKTDTILTADEFINILNAIRNL